MTTKSQARNAAMALCLAAACGCNVPVAREPLNSGTITAGLEPYTQGTWLLSGGAWSAVKSECRDCHWASPYPAGFDLTSQTIAGPSIQDFYSGVAQEKAPAIHLLAQAQYDTLLAWAVSMGASASTYAVPSTASWSMAAHIAGAASPSDGAAPGMFFGFRVEDNSRTQSLTISNVTDSAGRTLKALSIFDQTPVDQDSFSLSQNPTNYVVADGVAWHGRWKAQTFGGWIMQDRWLFVVFHAQRTKKGASPFGAREDREYVRLQIDRDWMSWRGKRVPADATETYPWSGPDPILTAAPGYSLNASPGYLLDSRWYWVEGEIGVVSGKMRYVARLKTEPGGTLLAEVGGERADVSAAYGSLEFGTYSTNQAGKGDRFADWTVNVSSMHGSGSQQGGNGCRGGCELD